MGKTHQIQRGCSENLRSAKVRLVFFWRTENQPKKVKIFENSKFHSALSSPPPKKKHTHEKATQLKSLAVNMRTEKHLKDPKVVTTSTSMTVWFYLLIHTLHRSIEKHLYIDKTPKFSDCGKWPTFDLSRQNLQLQSQSPKRSHVSKKNKQLMYELSGTHLKFPGIPTYCLRKKVGWTSIDRINIHCRETTRNEADKSPHLQF